MHFIIGFAFVLLSVSVVAQQPLAKSASAKECYAPSVWAYCADEKGNPLPPVCANPDDPISDTSNLKLCAEETTCSCDKPVLKPVAENLGTLGQPSRLFPPPRVLEWGGAPEELTPQKNLKNLQSESSYVVPFSVAEYSEDVDIINKQPVDSTPLYSPNGVRIYPLSGEQNINPLPGDIPKSSQEMFNGNRWDDQNRPVPVQMQTSPSSNENEPKYESPGS